MESDLLSNVNIQTNDPYLLMLAWFFSFPTKAINLNEITKALHISKTTANRTAKKLIKEKFLTLEVIGKTWQMRCNQHHEYNRTRKIAFNLMLTYETGIVETINKKFGNTASIILFGSYRKGDDNEKSDMDIAVELLHQKELSIEPLGIIKQLGFRHNITINLHVFSRKNIDTNLFANIANGIVLDGFLEVSA
ncbi:nucleotidyltransferase domain-containing protein [Candidatus Woesearchaeota archaeon]|nr:nucleotidyltransferase domain-containing protein [Candidatus Woesearchaeota archaeon]